MSEVHINKSDITNIANAIRTQKGQSSSTKYKASEMASAVGTLIQPTGTINITSNGTIDVTNYASANVNVSSATVIQDCTSLFQNNLRLTELNTLLPLCKPTTTEYMFANSSSLTSFDGSLLDMSNCTNAQYMFMSSGLVTISNLDTSNVRGTKLSQMFRYCSSLVNIDVMDASNADRLQNMFDGCTSLSNESLNNILLMCLHSGVITSTYKRLKDIGLSSAQATTCTELSNWPALQSVGWSTGY